MTAKKAVRTATLTLSEGRGGKVVMNVQFGPNLDADSPAHRTALRIIKAHVDEREAAEKSAPARQKKLPL